MPFTPSHAVLALPFARRPGLAAAIAVGAMAPDLPMFLRGTGVDYALTHDPRGIPVTVLIALALLLIWRVLLRPAARALAPRALGSRLPGTWDRGPASALRETFPSAGGAALVLVGIAAGIASHILWDGFTHEGRFGTVLLPALARPWGPLPGYKMLQYGSGLGGLIILGAAGALWLRGREPRPTAPAPRVLRLGWWLSLPMLLLGAVAVSAVLEGPPASLGAAYRLAGTLPPVVGLWGILTVGLALVLRLGRPGSSYASSPSASASEARDRSR